MSLKQLQPLAGSCQRKAAIIPIDGIAGIRSVFLYALDPLDVPIEHAEVVHLGVFLNHHLSAMRHACTKAAGSLGDDSIRHGDSPVDWQLGNFTRFVREHGVTENELGMMLQIAIAARHVIRGA